MVAVAAMVVVALAYFFVGFQKLRFSGVEWFESDNLRWVLYASSDQQASPNGLALFVANRAWLAHVLAAATMATERVSPAGDGPRNATTTSARGPCSASATISVGSNIG